MCMSCLRSESESCTGVLSPCVANTNLSLFHLMSWYSSFCENFDEVLLHVRIFFLLMHLLQLSVAGMPREFKQSLKSSMLCALQRYSTFPSSRGCVQGSVWLDILQIIPFLFKRTWTSSIKYIWKDYQDIIFAIIRAVSAALAPAIAGVTFVWAFRSNPTRNYAQWGVSFCVLCSLHSGARAPKKLALNRTLWISFALSLSSINRISQLDVG